MQNGTCVFPDLHMWQQLPLYGCERPPVFTPVLSTEECQLPAAENTEALGRVSFLFVVSCTDKYLHPLPGWKKACKVHTYYPTYIHMPHTEYIFNSIYIFNFVYICNYRSWIHIYGYEHTHTEHGFYHTQYSKVHIATLQFRVSNPHGSSALNLHIASQVSTTDSEVTGNTYVSYTP